MQSSGKWGEARAKPGFVPALELHLQSDQWLVKSTSPAASGPQRPAVALAAIQARAAQQLPFSALLSLRGQAPGSSVRQHCLDSLAPWSSPGNPSLLFISCSELCGRELTMWLSARCHISSQRWWKQCLCELHQRCFYRTERSFSVGRSTVCFPFLYILCSSFISLSAEIGVKGQGWF